MEVYVIIPIFWLICGILCAFIASRKNRSGVAWFFLGFLTGIIGLILVFFVEEIEYEEFEDDDVVYICEKCGNQVILDKKDLKNIDIVVCMNCKNEIKIKKELQKNEKKTSLTCPGCGEDLFFDKKESCNVECPKCNTKIKLK